MSISEAMSKVKADYNKAVVEFWRANPDSTIDEAAKHGEGVVRENQRSGHYGILGFAMIGVLLTSLYLNLKAIFAPDEPANESYIEGLCSEPSDEKVD